MFFSLIEVVSLLFVSSAVSFRGPVHVSLHLSSNSSALPIAVSNLSNVTSENVTRSLCITGGMCLEYTGTAEDAAEVFPWQYNVTEFAQYSPRWRTATTTDPIHHSGDLGFGATNVCIDGRLVPSFYLIGAQKAATSSFAADLVDHAGKKVVLAEMTTWSDGQRMLFSKELHFFDNSHRFQKGKQFWLDHWPQCPSTHMVAADFTPSYLSTWEAAMRLKQMYGPQSWKLSFLIILREPLARMQSSYYHGISDGWVSNQYKTFQLYVEAAVWKYRHGKYRKFHDCVPTPSVGKDFFGTSGVPFSLSLYLQQIKHWTVHFNPNQIMIAPMKAYIKPKGGKKLVNMVSSWNGLDVKTLPKQKVQKKAPHLNTHPHPTVAQDLKPQTFIKIKQIFNQATGPHKLAALLSPLMNQGLVLYGYPGKSSNRNWIARYLQNHW